jgi:hypothetical protein
MKDILIEHTVSLNENLETANSLVKTKVIWNSGVIYCPYIPTLKDQCMMKRMYILVLDDIPVGYAINSACHAAVSCTLMYQNTEEVKEWLDTSFRKVTCKVTKEEFDKAIALEPDYVIMTELKLDNRVMCVAFKPRENYDTFFKYLKLYS